MADAPASASTYFQVLRRLRAPFIVVIAAYAISITGFVLIPGTRDDGSPWQMDFFHAFYFVSYMGSTIGFGELPYPFNGGQRLWTLFSIYATVISWFYAITKALRELGDPAFSHQIQRSRVSHKIRRLREPFYIVCGYGEAGKVVVRFLSEIGHRLVIVERDPEAVNQLRLADLPGDPLIYPGDAEDPSELLAAGINHRYGLCRGVIAVAGNDQVNLGVAISAKLLDPAAVVVGRVNQFEDTADNMKSFNTDHIVNPFHTFAWHFSLAFSSPGHYLLNDWLSHTDYQELNQPVFPRRGLWIVCGFGRLGKEMHRRLEKQGNEVVVVEAQPDISAPPPGSIRGRGTEAITLRQARIDAAVGIVAATDDDANNLSIIVTARELNPDLFTVGRQNRYRSAPLFAAAGTDIVFNQNRLIANQVINLLTTPLTHDYLKLANTEEPQWANQIVSRISAVVDENAPYSWVQRLSEADSPAFTDARRRGLTIRLADLYREPHNRKKRLHCVALLIRRRDENLLHPADDTILYRGDRILFCGKRDARRRMDSTVNNNERMGYVVTGRHEVINPVWKKLFPAERP